MNNNLQYTEEFSFCENDVKHTEKQEEFAKKICMLTKKEQEEFCKKHNENSTEKKIVLTTKDDIITPTLTTNK